jgi:hypothetical protein
VRKSTIVPKYGVPNALLYTVLKQFAGVCWLIYPKSKRRLFQHFPDKFMQHVFAALKHKKGLQLAGALFG